MQSPIKLSKTNPRLSGSRREQKSYTTRYKQKAKITLSLPTTPASAYQESCKESQISSRGERFIELIPVQGSMENIKIEQEADEYQVMKNEYMETELLWSKKMSQTRSEINELKENIKYQQKSIKEMEKVLSSKRTRLIALEQKRKKSSQALAAIPVQNFDEFINNFQEEYDKINEIGEKEMSQACKQCEQLQHENDTLDQQLQEMQDQIVGLNAFESERYNLNLTTLLEEEAQMKKEIDEMQKQLDQISKNIKEKEDNRPIKEEVHRKYLQLYEKMLINKQLDKMNELITYKQNEIQRFDDYGRSKMVYRDKKKGIEQIESRITLKKQTINQLQEEIRDRSTILLNLYQMESMKSK